MYEISPIYERELVIDDATRAEFRGKIDPLINSALESRCYTEDRTPVGHTYLDRENVLASAAYVRYLGKLPFHGLKVSTTHEVHDGDRILTRAQLELSRIGGFGKSKLTKDGSHYLLETLSANEAFSTEPPTPIPDAASQDIMQDIRSYTELFHTDMDRIIPADENIDALENLNVRRRIDKRAHYEILTSEEHGDIQMNIGESYELGYVHVGDKIKKRRTNVQKMFELIARQPLDNGFLLLGSHYSSGNHDINAKLTTQINGTDYSDEDKQAYYADVLRTHQEIDVRKFGRGVIANLNKIIDENSDVIRLG